MALLTLLTACPLFTLSTPSARTAGCRSQPDPQCRFGLACPALASLSRQRDATSRPDDAEKLIDPSSERIAESQAQLGWQGAESCAITGSARSSCCCGSGDLRSDTERRTGVWRQGWRRLVAEIGPLAGPDLRLWRQAALAPLALDGTGPESVLGKAPLQSFKHRSCKAGRT